MKRYLEYTKIVLRHKWFVFLACLQIGAPLHLAILHDLSKLYPREFIPYALHFYNPDGSKRKVRNSDGSYDPIQQEDKFLRAWMNHQRNKHHWQAWCVIGDNGAVVALPMPEKYALEMVADWIGAGMAYSGKDDPFEWYQTNKSKMTLHPKTAEFVERLIVDIHEGKVTK